MERKQVMTRHYGGRNAYGEPLYIDRPIWVDVPQSREIPADTVRFPNVKENAAVIAAESRWNHLVENLPKVRAEVENARESYQNALRDYATGMVSMDMVAEKKNALVAAESVLEATEYAIKPTQSAVINARKEAIEEGKQLFLKEVTILSEERKMLLARLDELEEYYRDLSASFQSTDNILARFICGASLRGIGNVVTDGDERAVMKFTHRGLDVPTERENEETKPKSDVMRWKSER